MRPVASFTIACTEIIRQDGSLVGKLPAFAEDRDEGSPPLPGHGPHPDVRYQGGRPATHRATGHLRLVAWPRGGGGRHRCGDAAGGRAPALVPRARRAALARRPPGGGAGLLGRRRARLVLHGPARRLPDLRAGRHAGVACGGRSARVQAARRAAGCGVRVRGWRHFQGRRLRGHEPRRRLALARGVRRQQQRMGDLRAAQGARPRPRPWRRRRSPPASRASRSTATM